MLSTSYRPENPQPLRLISRYIMVRKCVEEKIGRCRVANGDIGESNAHNCIKCSSPIHAICGTEPSPALMEDLAPDKSVEGFGAPRLRTECSKNIDVPDDDERTCETPQSPSSSDNSVVSQCNELRALDSIPPVTVPQELIPGNVRFFALNVLEAHDVRNVIVQHNIGASPCTDVKHRYPNVAGSLSQTVERTVMDKTDREADRKRKYRSIPQNRERENEARRKRYRRKKYGNLHGEESNKRVHSQAKTSTPSRMTKRFIPFESNVGRLNACSRNQSDGKLKSIRVRCFYEVERWYHTYKAK
ncbi:hypothetical protein FGB62_92g14 [Gracilaria domingensis]|nr:hypothetical protein FGB62_92g14 [Gracilaria domingensis]